MANTLYCVYQHTQLSTVKMIIFTLEYEKCHDESKVIHNTKVHY